MGFILFIVAAVLTAIFGSIGLIISVVVHLVTLRFKDGLKAIDDLFLTLAITIDQLGNVLCATLFNNILIKINGYKFGSRLLTVSYVLGMNKRKNTLTWLGKALVFLLDVIDPNHVEKAIASHIKDLNDVE